MEAKADFRESVEDCLDLALADGECVPETFLERGSREVAPLFSTCHLQIEKAEMLPILVRAEECVEKADALYKQMYNFIWEEHERGKSDIAEEDWNGIVRPLEGQAY